MVRFLQSVTDNISGFAAAKISEMLEVRPGREFFLSKAAPGAVRAHGRTYVGIFLSREKPSCGCHLPKPRCGCGPNPWKKLRATGHFL